MSTFKDTDGLWRGGTETPGLALGLCPFPDSSWLLLSSALAPVKDSGRSHSEDQKQTGRCGAEPGRGPSPAALAWEVGLRP